MFGREVQNWCYSVYWQHRSQCDITLSIDTASQCDVVLSLDNGSQCDIMLSLDIANIFKYYDRSLRKKISDSKNNDKVIDKMYYFSLYNSYRKRKSQSLNNLSKSLNEPGLRVKRIKDQTQIDTTSIYPYKAND